MGLNAEGVKALSALERSVFGDDPEKTGLVNFHSEVDQRQHQFLGSSVKEDLFGKLLSYCSCLYLANWIRDQEGESCMNNPFGGYVPDKWWEDTSKLREKITQFTTAREAAYTALIATGTNGKVGPIDANTLDAA